MRKGKAPKVRLERTVPARDHMRKPTDAGVTLGYDWKHHTCTQVYLFLCKKKGCMTRREIAQKMQINYNAVSECLEDLEKHNLVSQDQKKTRSGMYRCYFANVGMGLVRADRIPKGTKLLRP